MICYKLWFSGFPSVVAIIFNLKKIVVAISFPMCTYGCRFLKQWTLGQDKVCLMLLQEKLEKGWIPYLFHWNCYAVFHAQNFRTRSPIYVGKKGRYVCILSIFIFCLILPYVLPLVKRVIIDVPNLLSQISSEMICH